MAPEKSSQGRGMQSPWDLKRCVGDHSWCPLRAIPEAHRGSMWREGLTMTKQSGSQISSAENTRVSWAPPGPKVRNRTLAAA